MSDFYDAFQELKGLEDATFSFDKPGILKLNTFLNMDDNEDNTLIVVDPDAETAEDTQGKDYNGEVILKCDVCGGLITKEPEDVVIDEETQKANVEEECPYCYNIGGYDIVGEVKVPETLEYEEVDEFGDRTNDTEKDAVGYDIPSDDNIEEDFTGGPVEFVERTGGVDIYKRADGKYIATAHGKSVTADTVNELKAKLAGADEEERKRLDNLPEDYDKDAGKIAKFIEDAVNGLKNGEGTNYRYKLDDRLAIFVGWSEGFDEDDETVIHDEEDPEYGIVAGIKVWTSDDMWTDFDYLNFPYYENGEVLDYMTSDISPNVNYTATANLLISLYDKIKDLDIDEDGKIIEDTEEIEESLNEAKNPKFIGKKGRPLTEDEIDKFVDVINRAVGQLSYKGYRRIFDVNSISVDESNNVEQKSPYADPYVKITLPTSTLGSRKFKNFYGDTITDINNIIFNCRYREGYTEGTDEDLDEGQYAVKITTDGTKKGYKQRADKKYRWEGTDFYLYDDTISEFESGIKNWIAKFIDEILGNSPKSFTSQPYYGEESAKYEEPSLQFTNEDLSKDAVNIIGRKEAAKRFNKGEEIYVGLKGNRDLWGFVKDDETPTFKDVEDYVTDDGAVKASDIVYAVANTSKTESYSRKEKKSLKEEFSGGVLEFPSGDYVYVDVEDGKLVAGSATNTGIMHEYELDIEGEEPTDAELQDMYDMIVDKHPEYLEESCKKGKRKLKEQISDSAYEVAEILEKEFGNKEKVSMDEFDSAFGRATKKVLGDKEPDEDFETDVRSILSMSGFETEFEGDNEGGLSRLGESCKKGRKKIDESVKIISTLDEYTPWSGAKNTYAVIQDADKVDALDAYLEDIYPEGLTVTELNDLLWFDGDSVLSDLGIYTEDAIDTAIQDAVDEAQGESFEDTDELEFFLTRHIEDAMNGVSVNIDISDEEVEITVEDTTRSFALTDFTVGEIEESLKEAKEEVEDFYDVVYDTITGQKKIKGTSNPIRGCINPDNMGIDRETGNMLAKCRTEKEADKVEKYVKDMFGDEGVTTIRKKNKHDKDFPIGVVIDVPEERIIKDIEDKVVTTDESLTESVEGVTVTTDTDVVNVDVTDTDGVTVDVQGKDSVDNTEEATIEPVSDETKEEIVANSEEGESEEGAEGEMLSDEFDEFNEEEFDELGESYLKEVYDNVKSFKTTRGVMDKDRIKLEGIIEFNSGKKAKTSFVFEKYMTTPRGKFKLLGENLQLTSRKNAFILTGSIQERKLCMEALTYKYTAKDAKGGKSKQVYGTKKLTK